MPFSLISLPADQASQACREITAVLPEWFGIASANEAYSHGCLTKISFAAKWQQEIIGLLALEIPYPTNGNLYWLGVKPDFHRQGVGQKLLCAAANYLKDKQVHSLTVETLSPRENNPLYLATFQFYLKNGFRPLFDLTPYDSSYAMVYMQKQLCA